MSELAVAVLREEWQRARRCHGWAIGRYVICLIMFISFAQQTSMQSRVIVYRLLERVDEQITEASNRCKYARLAGSVFRPCSAIN